MKILLYYSGDLADPTRGTPLRIYALYRALSKHADVHLVAKTKPAELSGAFTPLPSAPPFLHWFVRWRFLRKLARELRVDLVYANTHASMLPVALLASSKIKTCIDLHGLPHIEQGKTGIAAWFADRLHKALLRRFSGYTAVCSNLTEYYAATGTSGYTLYGGVDVNEIAPIRAERIASTDICGIVYVGNIRSYQGLPYLLQALRLIKDLDWHFVFVCSSDLDEARALILQFGLDDRTTLLGPVTHARALGILKGADIAVVPRPSEPITDFAFPSKLPEYLAASAAVIATDVSDARELVMPGKTGWLVVPGSEQELADALQDALAHPDKRASYAQAGKEHAQRHFNWDTHVQRLMPYLESLQ